MWLPEAADVAVGEVAWAASCHGPDGDSIPVCTNVSTTLELWRAKVLVTVHELWSACR